MIKEMPERITIHTDREDVMECWSVSVDEPVEDVGTFDVEYVRADLYEKLEAKLRIALDNYDFKEEERRTAVGRQMALEVECGRLERERDKMREIGSRLVAAVNNCCDDCTFSVASMSVLMGALVEMEDVLKEMNE